MDLTRNKETGNKRMKAIERSSRKLCFFLCLLSCVAMTTILFLPISAKAQNNVFKINDKLYKVYTKVHKDLRKKSSLKTLDSLFVAAKRIGDVKAQCIFACGKVDYFLLIEKNDISHLEKEAQQAMNFCKKTPYKYYYFFVWQRLITRYTENSLYSKALAELEKMKQEAFRIGNNAAIATCYFNIGNIYLRCLNYKQAVSYYKEAIPYRIKNDPQNLFSIVEAIVNVYIACDKIDEAIIFLPKAKNYLTGISQHRAYYELLSNLYYMKEDMAKFLLYRELASKSKEKQEVDSRDLYTYINDVFYFSHKGDSATLTSRINRLKDSKEKSLLYSYIARERNQYYNALVNYRKAKHNDNDSVTDKFKILLYKLSTTFEEGRLEKEKSKLAIEAAGLHLLSLRNQEKDLEQKNYLEKLITQRGNIELHKSRLLLKKRLKEAEKEKAERLVREEDLKTQKSEIKWQKQLKGYYIAGTLIIFIVFIYMLYSWIKTVKANKILIKNKHRLERAQIKAKEARNKAKEADNQKTQFIKDISHEIRTPLNAIVGFSSVIASAKNGELSQKELEEFTKSISKNSDLLTTLVNDILDLANLQSGNYKLSWKQVNIKDLCNYIISNIKGKIPAQIEFIFNPSPLPPAFAEITTDMSKVEQILTNFLTNAIKYTKEGSISLSYKPLYESEDTDKPTHIVFAVTNTGSRIPDDKAKKIFNRFEKLDNFKQGSGLGLNISKLLGGILQGNVWLDTSYDDGTRFCLKLPFEVKNKEQQKEQE